MTLQELLAFLGGVGWALLWAPVGGHFAWWVGAAAFVAGGFAGLVAGWAFGEWLNRPRPKPGPVRGVTALALTLLGFAAFVALPVWALTQVRAGS